MARCKLQVGNVEITCSSFDEASKIGRPFVEKGIALYIVPIPKPERKKVINDGN